MCSVRFFHTLIADKSEAISSMNYSEHYLEVLMSEGGIKKAFVVHWLGYVTPIHNVRVKIQAG